jgi:hypothetical protein
VSAWNWDGAALLLEHCDALMPSWAPSKGFLSLEDELAALATVNREANAPLRCLINWGRSTIEGRSVATAPAHIERARSAGLLGGLMFSGCSDDAAARGGAWADFHLPPTAALRSGETSLLSPDATRAALAAAADVNALTVLGMKIGAAPDASLSRRLDILRRSAAALTPRP